MHKVILKPKKEESLLRFHPWVFSGAIHSIQGKPAEGDLVEVFDCRDNFLATGHYQIGSISVRMLSFSDEPIDADPAADGRADAALREGGGHGA